MSVQILHSVPEFYFFGTGGTAPSSILAQPAAVSQIKDSDLWVLLTDGEVPDREVTQLATLAEQEAVTQVPVILLITGGHYTSPERENISVGITFFASATDALILYKSIKDGALYVVDAKGVFQGLGDPTSDLSDWNKLPKFASEEIFKKELASRNITFDAERGLRERRGISLGPHWNLITDNGLVKVNELLEQGHIASKDLRNLLQEEAISQLALTCKIRGRLDALRNLLIRHKQQEMVVRLEDSKGAGKLIAELQATTDTVKKLQLGDQLRQAHAANRAAYQHQKNNPGEEVRLVAEQNRLIDRGLRIISGFEKSSYTADILNRKSNRAMRADIVSTADTGTKLAALDLADGIKAFRGSCSICCGDSEIMSVVLKQLETVEENTSDFALNFPLAAAHSKHNADIISSQSICFQCALLMDRSIYKENIVAILPALEFAGPNKTYMIHQLYLALTAGLATGASILIQLFAGILDRTFNVKAWCAKDGDEEAFARRGVLEWLLHTLLENCICRENFTETGKWVNYPQALKWAVNDFKTAGLDSWIIQYPIAGFTQLMRWYEILDLDVDKELVIAKQHAKLVHYTTSCIMSKMLKSSDSEKWQNQFLRVIYDQFNAPGVPLDDGQGSLIATNKFWERLETALEADRWADVRYFLSLFKRHEDHSIERVQIIVFWALFTQKSHTTPKTFFANLKLREPLASTVLDTLSPLLKQAVSEVLLSIFCTSRKDRVFVIHNTGAVPPFVSPYGPSVLQCGHPGCGVKFYDPAKANKEILQQTVREGRAKHLAEAFKADNTFNGSQTGLPDATAAPKAPSSFHITLHISTARTWHRLDQHRRRKVMHAIEDGSDSTALTKFIGDVCYEVCAKSHRGESYLSRPLKTITNRFYLGNIYSHNLTDDIRNVLPSFAKALKTASVKLGLKDSTGVGFEHDWTQNTVAWKLEYELGLQEQENS